MKQRAFGGFQCLFRGDWSLRWLDVCTCTDASEKGFAFAVREGCRELASEVGRVSEWTRFKRDRLRSGPSLQMPFWRVQVRTRTRCRLPDGRVSWSLLGCHCNFSIPRCRNWRPVVSSYVPSCMPCGGQRVNIRWCWRSAQDVQTHLTLLSVMRRIFASGFRAGSVLSFRWIPSEMNHADKCNRFFDRDYDPSKSLHVPAQRSPRSSPARTIDQDSFSLMMHPDVGDVDFTSHFQVPAGSAQPHTPSDDLSSCTGHAAAVSTQWSSFTGKSDSLLR